MRPWLLAWALPGCGCGQDGPTPLTDEPPTTCTTDLTWNGFGQPFFGEWCTSCHSQNANNRYGAPEAVNLDTYAGVVQWAPLVQVVAVDNWNTDAQMPPAGGVAESDIALLDEWLRCGMPEGDGATPEIDPCMTETVWPGDASSADGVCATANVVAGALHADADADWTCICRVDGDVLMEGATRVDLPLLHTVGGSVTAVDRGELAAFTAPLLETVGGHLRWEALPGLTEIDLKRVTTVGADAVFSDLGALGILDVSEIETVGGAMRVERTGLVELDFARLETVGTDLVLAENPTLVRLTGTTVLASVPGDLLVFDNDGLELDFQLFDALTSVGGNLEIVGNDAIRSVLGFDALTEVCGHLWIRENGALNLIGDHYFLAHVGGALVIEDNPALSILRDFDSLYDVGLSGDPTLGEDLFRVAGNPLLTGLLGPINTVVEVGAIEVEGNGLASTLGDPIGLFGALAAVRGDISVINNDAIDMSLVNLGAVGGDVVISGNDALIALTIALGDGVVSGDLRIADHGELTGIVFGDGLTDVAGALRIEQNSSLVGLAAPEQLERAGSLAFEDLPDLVTVGDWKDLVTVDGDLTIRGTAALVDLEGLDDVEEIGGSLRVEENSALTSLAALTALDTIGADLRVVENESLPTDEADELVDRVGLEDIGGEVVIEGNAP